MNGRRKQTLTPKRANKQDPLGDCGELYLDCIGLVMGFCTRSNF